MKSLLGILGFLVILTGCGADSDCGGSSAVAPGTHLSLGATTGLRGYVPEVEQGCNGADPEPTCTDNLLEGIICPN